MIDRIGFSRQFAKRMRLLAVVTWIIISIAMPATYLALSYGDRHRSADLRGELLADNIKQAIHDNPELWHFDIPRFLEVAHRFPDSEPIVSVRIFTDTGVLAYEEKSGPAAILDMTTRTPIRYNNRVYGTLEIVESIDHLFLSSFLALSLFCLLGAAIAYTIYRFPLGIVLAAERKIYGVVDELQHSRDDLRRLADRDAKTRLYNTAYMIEQLKTEIDVADEHSAPFSVLMLDIDYFKKYNDKFGHVQGDVLLTQLADLLTRLTRSRDTLGRFGGEEFLLLMRGAGEDEAREAAFRLQRAVSTHGFPGEDSQPGGRLTVSIGLIAYRPGMTAEQMLHHADGAMYAAKEAGRNQVCISDGQTFTRDGDKIIRVADIAFASDTIGQLIEKLETASRRQIPSAHVSTLMGFLKALDSRESNTAQHSLLVNKIAMSIGQNMGLSEKELLQLNWGTLLHDIGKLAIADSILLKPGSLTPEEYEAVKLHPTFGYDLLKNNDYLDAANKIILYHHERWDGDGYPYGLKGTQIPYLARICAVADAAASMAEDRPYRKALTPAGIVAEIRRNAQTQFDPGIVAVFGILASCVLPAVADARLMNEIKTVPGA
ncbi:MAG: diguanylate cyclase [Sporomusaceae bacterium]|nr:diguanylate cyclase [Sporomusaceae bacterium]